MKGRWSRGSNVAANKLEKQSVLSSPEIIKFLAFKSRCTSFAEGPPHPPQAAELKWSAKILANPCAWQHSTDFKHCLASHLNSHLLTPIYWRNIFCPPELTQARIPRTLRELLQRPLHLWQSAHVAVGQKYQPKMNPGPPGGLIMTHTQVPTARGPSLKWLANLAVPSATGTTPATSAKRDWPTHGMNTRAHGCRKTNLRTPFL